MEGEKCALMLLKSGADPNITMENGETPLHVAARHGRLRIIRLLLQDGANPQQRAKVSKNKQRAGGYAEFEWKMEII